MGRDTNRQTRKIKFNGRTSAVYRPTDGQVAVIAITGASLDATDGPQAAQRVVRFFDLCSSLFVDPADWMAVEKGLTHGTILMADINRLAQQLFGHQWPPPRPADDGDDEIPMLSEYDDEDPPAPTSAGIDGEGVEDIDAPPAPPTRRTRRK